MSRALKEDEVRVKCPCGRYFIVQPYKEDMERKLCHSHYIEYLTIKLLSAADSYDMVYVHKAVEKDMLRRLGE
jgi:hypothetical protein